MSAHESSPPPPPPPPPPPVPPTQQLLKGKSPEKSHLSKIKSAEGTQLFVLHKHPEFFDHTLALLDDQWPHSHKSMLLSSSDSLPLSVILVDPVESRVLGHAQLSDIVGDAECTHIYISSVLVAPLQRGRGYGRVLM